AQYLGDGIVMYFGWPAAHEDDAARAIHAGLEMAEAVTRLAAPIPLAVRVGIHTGLVVVGQTGQGDASVPKGAVGETLHIAARLQARADPGGVLVRGRRRGLAAGLFDYAVRGAPPLRGPPEPMRLFRATGARLTESRFEAARGGLGLTPFVGREQEIA